MKASMTEIRAFVRQAIRCANEIDEREMDEIRKSAKIQHIAALDLEYLGKLSLVARQEFWGNEPDLETLVELHTEREWSKRDIKHRKPLDQLVDEVTIAIKTVDKLEDVQLNVYREYTCGLDVS